MLRLRGTTRRCSLAVAEVPALDLVAEDQSARSAEAPWSFIGPWRRCRGRVSPHDRRDIAGDRGAKSVEMLAFESPIFRTWHAPTSARRTAAVARGALAGRSSSAWPGGRAPSRASWAPHQSLATRR